MIACDRVLVMVVPVRGARGFLKPDVLGHTSLLNFYDLLRPYKNAKLSSRNVVAVHTRQYAVLLS